MAIRCQQYEVSSGTLLFDFEIDSSPDDHRSLAERLKDLEHEGKPTEGGQRMLMLERPVSTSE